MIIMKVSVNNYYRLCFMTILFKNITHCVANMFVCPFLIHKLFKTLNLYHCSDIKVVFRKYILFYSVKNIYLKCIILQLETVYDVLLNISLLIALLGGIVFIVSFAGCIGALRENTCLLKFVSIKYISHNYFNINFTKVVSCVCPSLKILHKN